MTGRLGWSSLRIQEPQESGPKTGKWVAKDITCPAIPRRFLGVVRDFITGVRYFGQGFGLLARRPRLLLIGMLPAVLTTWCCWAG